MKKSQGIVLGITLVLAQACSSPKEQQQDDWTYGEPNSKDTVVNGQPYRSHYGLFYPILLGRISPSTYNGATASEISRPGYTPRRTGGFGSTGRTRSVYS